MVKERIEYLDMIKGIAILFVVFCHNVVMPRDTFLGNILMAIAWGAVPCFFMVTGGILHASVEFKWRKHFIKLVKTYFVLCAWKLIYLIYFNLMGNFAFSNVDVFRYIFMFGNIDGINAGHVWFMQAYLASLIFFPISQFLFWGKVNGKRVLMFVASVQFFFGIFINTMGLFGEIVSKGFGFKPLSFTSLNVVSPFGNYQNMLFYFVIGAFLLENRDKIQNYLFLNSYRRHIPKILFFVGVCGLVLIKYWQTRSFYWEGTYLVNGYGWSSTMLLAIGAYLMIQNSNYSSDKKIICNIGRETMGIFYLHILVLELILKYGNKYMINYYSCGLNIVKTIMVVVICVLLTQLLKKIPILKLLVS